MTGQAPGNGNGNGAGGSAALMGLVRGVLLAALGLLAGFSGKALLHGEALVRIEGRIDLLDSDVSGRLSSIRSGLDGVQARAYETADDVDTLRGRVDTLERGK